MKALGFSVIELMVAMSVSLLLSGLLFSYYIDANGSLSAQTTIYHLQEIVNVSCEIISNEIQEAGYLGCAKIASGFPVEGNNGYTLTASNQLIVSDHYLISRHASKVAASFIALLDERKTLYISENLSVKPRDILIISDCAHAEIFQVKKMYRLTHKIKIELDAPLHSDFLPTAEIAFLEINRLFVDNIRKKDLYGKTISALYIENIHHRRKQLLEDIDAIDFVPHFQAGKLQSVSFSQKIHLSSLKREWQGYARTNQ